MAKTNFQNGTIVTPDFLNGVFSHIHDGVNNDGHCSKINLTNAAEVQGILPFENVESHSHPELENALEYLRIREDLRMGGAFIITFGGFETYQTIECFWWREQYLVVPASSKYYGVYLVTLAFESLLATSSFASFTSSMSTNPTIPEELWPRSQVVAPCTVINNGYEVLGFVNIHTNGIVSFSLLNEDHHPYMTFSDQGQKGFNAFAVTYPVFVPIG